MKIQSLAGLVLLLISPAALAGDYYVDIQNGDNGQGDGSAGSPWQTITHAIYNIPSPSSGHTIHIAPGTYSDAAGETFPLRPYNRMELVADDGPETTIIEATVGASSVIAFDEYRVPISAQTLVEGIAIRGASFGILVESDEFGSKRPTLRNLTISGCGSGIYLAELDNSIASPQLVDVRCFENQIGIRVSARTFTEAINCDFSWNADIGIRVSGSNFDGHNLDLLDCRVIGNGNHGIYLTPGWQDGVSVDATNCVIAHNRIGGEAVIDESSGSNVWIKLYNCTVTGNTEVGLRAHHTSSGWVPSGITAHNSIIAGNHLDVDEPNNIEIEWSNVGSGSFTDAGGNISVDPQFIGLIPGDWHLAANSPCIDAGDPEGPLDPDGSIRDMGAFPYDPSHEPGSALYCATSPNSVGPGATMDANGSAYYFQNDLIVAVDGCPPNRLGLFFYGTAPAQAPFLNGSLCVSPPLSRLAPQATSPEGHANRPIDRDELNPSTGPVLPGTTLYFQFYYRDPAAGGAMANLSNGLRIRYEL